MHINATEKARIDGALKDLQLANSNELEYAITMLCMKYCISTINEMHLATVLGALDMVKIEFYDRVVKPYHAHQTRVLGNIFHEFVRKHNL